MRGNQFASLAIFIGIALVFSLLYHFFYLEVFVDAYRALIPDLAIRALVRSMTAFAAPAILLLLLSSVFGFWKDKGFSLPKLIVIVTCAALPWFTPFLYMIWYVRVGRLFY